MVHPSQWHRQTGWRCVHAMQYGRRPSRGTVGRVQPVPWSHSHGTIFGTGSCSSPSSSLKMRDRASLLTAWRLRGGGRRKVAFAANGPCRSEDSRWPREVSQESRQGIVGFVWLFFPCHHHLEQRREPARRLTRPMGISRTHVTSRPERARQNHVCVCILPFI